MEHSEVLLAISKCQEFVSFDMCVLDIFHLAERLIEPTRLVGQEQKLRYVRIQPVQNGQLHFVV